MRLRKAISRIVRALSSDVTCCKALVAGEESPADSRTNAFVYRSRSDEHVALAFTAMVMLLFEPALSICAAD